MRSTTSFLMHLLPTRFCFSRHILWSILGSFFLLGACCHSEADPSTLKGWGLPVDLGAHLDQLEILRLPRAVDRLDWLSNHLRVLVARQTAIRDLQGLPDALDVLDISYTGVKNLHGLPDSLAALYMTNCDATDFEDLPRNLSALAIGGTQIKSLEGIPESLSELTIDDVDIKDLKKLPRHLESLSWQGSRLEVVDHLPSSLKILRLNNAGLKNLKLLPGNLQSLELLLGVNTEVGLEDLPVLLANLTIDENYTPDLFRLQYLQHLDVRRIRSQIDHLPNSVTQVQVDPKHIDELKPWPPFLRKLSLLTGGPPNDEIDLSQLPSSLESLDITRCLNTDLRGLPPALRELDISFSQVQKLDSLPGSLRVLKFRWSKLMSLPTLPRSIKHLDLSGSKDLKKIDDLPPALIYLNISNTPISTLTLPPTLQRLDISNSAIHDLKGLPQGLESLRLAVGQVRNLKGLPESVRVLEFVEH